MVPVARPLQAVVPLPPAAIPVAAVDPAVVPLDRLDLVVHLVTQDLADLADHQVVEDTTAADTRNTKVLSYRSSKELRVRCAC